MQYVPRRAGDALQRLLRVFPAVLVFGPRQCGKSTLVRRLLPGWLQLDLERPRDAALLEADPEEFFRAHPRRIVLDEAQRVTGLFPVLRHVLDRSRGKGRVVLTGSATPDLLRTAAETLAGRIGLLELTPFRMVELARTRFAEGRWFWGGYPAVHTLSGAAARADWLDGYLTTVLDRDLPALGLRLPPPRLRRLSTMLTHVHGSLLNVSDLARSLGVSAATVDHDLDALEGVFFLRRLPSYHVNIQKRLTKSPKIYLRDSGLLHFLAGLRRPSDLETWHRRGQSFEGLVVEEVVALAREHIVRPDVFFWRTQAGAEIDLLISDGQRLVAIEIKLGPVNQYDIRSLRQGMADLGVNKGWIVTGSGERRAAGPDVEIVPWADVAAGAIDFGFGRPRRRQALASS
jgi:predicted AAA+ superfamily ATPase